MEELIKEAEGLYKQICEIQHDLIKSRLDVCNELTWKAISDMETAMCDMQKILNCIIDRKNNIVDLGEVWYDIDVEPQKGYWFLGQIGDYAYDTFIAEIEGKRMENWLEGCNIKRWAYVKDLLPKGGD